MKPIKYIAGYLLWPFCLLAGLRLIWGFDGLVGQDSYGYLDYATALALGEGAAGFFWPPLYAALGAVCSILGLPLADSLQMISMVSLAGIAWSCHQILRFRYPKSVIPLSLYLLFTLLLSPYLLRAGMTISSDPLAIWLCLLTVQSWDQYERKGQIRFIYLYALFALLAVLTRFIAPLLLLPFAFSLAFHVWKNKDFFHLIIALLLSLGGCLFIILQVGLGDMLFKHNVYEQWSFSHLWKASFEAVDGLHSYAFPNGIYIFFNWLHPGFFFGGVLLSPFLLTKKIFWTPFNRLCALSIGLYAIFLGGVPLQNWRFLMLSFPLIIMIYYPVLCYIQERWLGKNIRISVLIALLIQLGLVARSLAPSIKAHVLEKELTEMVCQQDEKEVLSFYVNQAVQYYCPEKRVYNLFYKNTPIAPGQLVLFHPTRFASQENTDLYTHWRYIQENYDLKIITNGPQGWRLYKINEKSSQP